MEKILNIIINITEKSILDLKETNVILLKDSYKNLIDILFEIISTQKMPINNILYLMKIIPSESICLTVICKFYPHPIYDEVKDMCMYRLTSVIKDNQTYYNIDNYMINKINDSILKLYKYDKNLLKAYLNMFSKPLLLELLNNLNIIYEVKDIIQNYLNNNIFK